MLMGIGSLATIGVKQPKNLLVVVLDNAHYGETGMQPSHTHAGIDFAAVALGCRFKAARTVSRIEEAAEVRKLLHSGEGPILVNAKIRCRRHAACAAAARRPCHQAAVHRGAQFSLMPERPSAIIIRDPAAADEMAWRELWSGYNAFYEVNIPEAITAHTWQRLLDPASPMFSRLAVADSVGRGL